MASERRRLAEEVVRILGTEVLDEHFNQATIAALTADAAAGDRTALVRLLELVREVGYRAGHNDRARSLLAWLKQNALGAP